MPAATAQAERFESYRPHLRAVATRLLGSAAEAEDVVQEAWFRFDRAGEAGIENLGGWLTTVVSRLCLDHLRSRSARGEVPNDPDAPEIVDDTSSPEHEAVLAEATAEALANVIDILGPIERVTFILHDVFDVPFEEIAAIVDRTPAATRQVASRARRRLRNANHTPRPFQEHQRAIVTAFFTASREGRLLDLIQLLAPDVVCRFDAAAARMGSATDVAGARAVAEVFSGRAQAARLATIDGLAGMVWAPGGNPRIAFRFTINGDAISAIDLIADADTIAAMTVVPDLPVRRRLAPGPADKPMV